jgi:hypothetical protein
MIEQWVGDCKEWGRWLTGNGPTPEPRALAMVGGTLGAIALVIAGVVLAFGGPGSAPRGAGTPSSLTAESPVTTAASPAAAPPTAATPPRRTPPTAATAPLRTPPTRVAATATTTSTTVRPHRRRIERRYGLHTAKGRAKKHTRSR